MTISRDIERRQGARRTLAVTAAGSILLHVVLVAMFVPQWIEALKEPPPPPEEKPLEIVAQYEEEPEPEPEPEPPAPEPEIAEAVEPPPPEPKPPEYKPEIADSAPAPSMTVASNQPIAEPEPPRAPPEPEPEPSASEEKSEPISEPEATAVEEESPVIMQKPKLDPKAFMMPSMQSYNQMFEKNDAVARERARELSKGKRLFKNYEKTTAAVKESLTSFGQEVNPGNHTGVDPHSHAFGSFVGMIHNKIHVRWANGYLMDLDLHEPAGSAMNNPDLNTKIEIVIRASDGEIEKINIVRSSGQVRFDAQAVALAYSTGPHPGAPPDLVSPDGRVYMHWNFWRDQRQCGVFGATVFIVGEQGGSPG